MARTITLARRVAWTLLAAALAFGGAGLIGQLTHPPGDARREELTWVADNAIAGRLDTLASGLEDVGSLVDALSGDAKDALIAVSSGDGEGLKTALDTGAARAATIDATVSRLRFELAGLPGDSSADTAIYSNATLVRRAELLAALDSVGALSQQWTSVTAHSTDAASLTIAIREHDTTLASAAASGVKAKYPEAIDLCNQALEIIDEIVQMRNDFVQADQGTVLDDWIARHLRYDKALLALYTELKKSGGVRNPRVDAAYREQTLALAELPKDNREIVVIIAEVAQAGLNQAVGAIEEARGRIDTAIAEASPG
jgi:hypothetical protein